MKSIQQRVLIADDNIDGAMSLEVLLLHSGYDVRVAHDGLGALELAQSFSPRAAILDIGMPGLTGYEVAEYIRAAPWGRRMVLIALTGWGQAADKRRAFVAGFDHHLTKPIEPDHLETLLRTVLSAERATGSS